jgi:nitrate reductase gamma subunit
MGPGLAGLSDRRSDEWISNWIKDSQGMVKAGDKDAVALFEKFNKIPMPGFPQLTDEEIKGFIEFVKEKGVAPAATSVGGSESSTAANDTGVTAAPADGISGIDLNSQFFFWCFLSLIVVGFLLFRFRRRTFKLVNEVGYHSEPHKIPNYGSFFLLFLLIAAIIIFLLVVLLNQKVGMINTLMFTVLPYLSFGVFLIGSIYRYTSKGYQVSSLSSQFLEGKKLFWGSLPFHWGLFILFFGHLIAFLFPSAVLAWNGQPVRLLILEVSSFAFGLSALLGLILLIKRRLEAKMLLVVTNKMDMVVYTVLFTQIISGLGVAFFVRWGSSWFSSVLTPYLRSIFSFNPDINAVSEMPWLIQIHIISAFLIIGIIPFTRFMHFLVAPFDYAWRKYQVVIWNWNPRNIRVSGRHFFGKKSRNH